MSTKNILTFYKYLLTTVNKCSIIMNVGKENKPARRERKMTTAKDIIRYVIEDIDSEIKMLESLRKYAEEKHFDIHEGKRSAMATGTDYLTACEKFDYSYGYHAAIANECEDRINVLKMKRDYYSSLEFLFTEEEEGNE